jgi:hypothetical protein
LEAERESIFALHRTTREKSFLAAKLDEASRAIATATAQFAILKEEQAAESDAANRFYESKDEIKSLLARFKQTGEKPDDLYRLRSQIALRIRSLVDTILVASVGSVPFVQEMIANAKAQPKLDKDRITDLENALGQERTNARYFTVRFKDGSIRGVMPKDDDPMQFDVQILGAEDQLQRIGQGNEPTPFANESDLTNLI